MMTHLIPNLHVFHLLLNTAVILYSKYGGNVKNTCRFVYVLTDAKAQFIE